MCCSVQMNANKNRPVRQHRTETGMNPINNNYTPILIGKCKNVNINNQSYVKNLFDIKEAPWF